MHTSILQNKNSCGDTHMSVHLPLFSSLAHYVSSLAMWPFSGPQLVAAIKQATPASHTSSPTAEQADQLSLG